MNRTGEHMEHGDREDAARRMRALAVGLTPDGTAIVPASW